MKIRWSYNHFISTMEFPVKVRPHLYIEIGPMSHLWFCQHMSPTILNQDRKKIIYCHGNLSWIWCCIHSREIYNLSVAVYENTLSWGNLSPLQSGYHGNTRIRCCVSVYLSVFIIFRQVLWKHYLCLRSLRTNLKSYRRAIYMIKAMKFFLHG